MGAITMAPDQVNTVVYGIADQAALSGLLARLETLGLEVIEVRRVSASRQSPRPHLQPSEEEARLIRRG